MEKGESIEEEGEEDVLEQVYKEWKECGKWKEKIVLQVGVSLYISIIYLFLSIYLSYRQEKRIDK